MTLPPPSRSTSRTLKAVVPLGPVSKQMLGESRFREFLEIESIEPRRSCRGWRT